VDPTDPKIHGYGSGTPVVSHFLFNYLCHFLLLLDQETKISKVRILNSHFLPLLEYAMLYKFSDGILLLVLVNFYPKSLSMLQSQGRGYETPNWRGVQQQQPLLRSSIGGTREQPWRSSLGQESSAAAWADTPMERTPDGMFILQIRL
jgi:hypothetical protein